VIRLEADAPAGFAAAAVVAVHGAVGLGAVAVILAEADVERLFEAGAAGLVASDAGSAGVDVEAGFVGFVGSGNVVAAAFVVAGDAADAAVGDGSAVVATAACAAVAEADADADAVDAAAVGSGSFSDSPDGVDSGLPLARNGCYRKSLQQCETRGWYFPSFPSQLHFLAIQVWIPTAE